MTQTPWGDSASLRARKLAPGRRLSSAEVERNQRERIFGALVATVADRGYEATRVADLERLAGVSRTAFYRLFDDKEDCFLAAVEALIGTTVAAIAAENVPAEPEPELRARRALRAFVELIVAQPAAARMCFVDVYAAGPRAARVVDRGMSAFEALVAELLEQMPGRAGMPAPIVRALIGGMRKIVHKRLYRGEEEQLRELAEPLLEWALSYETPPRPLRAPRRRPRADQPAHTRDPVARILRAIAAAGAEKGYPAVRVAEIVERAGTSRRTFYEHFINKEEALLATLDTGAAQMLAATLPAFRRERDWPRSIRGAVEALLAFGASEPEFAWLGAVEAYAAGPRALEQRDEVMEGLEGLLAPGYELAPGTPAIAAEAIGGAIYALIYDQLRDEGAKSLPDIAALATYTTLAPFLGAEQACAIANGEDQRP